MSCGLVRKFHRADPAIYTDLVLLHYLYPFRLHMQKKYYFGQPDSLEPEILHLFPNYPLTFVF